MNSIIKTVNLSKNFFTKKNLTILKKINIEIKNGSLVALLGPSGSGKSTFLHLIALLDQPSSGYILFDGIKTSEIKDDEKDKIRRNKISIIYQQNNLLSDFTSLENVMIAMIASGKNKRDSKLSSEKILNKVGLSKRLDHYPSDLSVGEQQRVAIARAVVTDPHLILADEPTGSLDQITSEEIFKLFLKFKSLNRTIVYATHNRELADRADYKLKIIDGNIRRSND
tara:strand:+ start:639 stop:1316 length:678 start_codon:yes stop_codon:yes gene_type:complete